jgi:hypothetical protein
VPEPSDQASQRQRHANWIGLRTLRQRPKLAGVLSDGELVYEVRSVRLLLRGQAPYFNRLVACERCGRDQAGAPVLTPADLDAPLRPMICTECVQKAGVSSVWEPEVVKPATELVNPAVAKTPDPALAPPASRAEHQTGALTARVDELRALVDAQGARDEDRRREHDAALMAVRGAMSQALGEVRAEIAAASAANASRVDALEANLRETVAALTGFIEAQRVDLTAVVTEMVQVRADVQAVAANGQDHETGVQATLEAAIDQRLQELAAQVAHATAASTTRLDELDERLGRLADQLSTVTAAVTAALIAAPTSPTMSTHSGVADGGAALLDALDAQLRGASDRIAALSADERLPSG